MSKEPEAGETPAVPDTANHFLVTAKANVVVIVHPPTRPITRLEALNLAAWLVMMADTIESDAGHKQFGHLLNAIKNS